MASLPGAFFEKGRSFLPCLFNSFDPYFKQPFGAVRAGQSVHLSLCIPEELGYVCLLYTSDAADEEDSVDLGGRGIIKKKII